MAWRTTSRSSTFVWGSDEGRHCFDWPALLDLWTGDLQRNAMKSGTPLGIAAKQALDD